MTGPGKVSGGSESQSPLARHSSELPLLNGELTPEVIAEGRRLLSGDDMDEWYAWLVVHGPALLDAAEFGTVS